MNRPRLTIGEIVARRIYVIINEDQVLNKHQDISKVAFLQTGQDAFKCTISSIANS